MMTMRIKFVEDVEQWITETGKWCNTSVSNAQTIETFCSN